MSQIFDADGETQLYGRGRRRKILSQRVSNAKADGSIIPGISPERALASHSFAESHEIFASPREQEAPPLPDPITPIETMPPLKSKPCGAADKYDLGPDKFAIYFWRTPQPKDFTNLDSLQRNWKARQDTKQKQSDVDNGQDDWFSFDNDIDNRGIASIFTSRAKRAFWTGKSWQEFEETERSIILATFDKDGKRIADPNALENNRRMEIFEAIKIRLCEEIWLEGYVEPPTLPSHWPGAKVTAPVRSDTPVVVTIAEREPTKEESAQSIVKWTQNAKGYWEPWYEGEDANPSGIAKMKQAIRSDMALKSQSVSDIEDGDPEWGTDIQAYAY